MPRITSRAARALRQKEFEVSKPLSDWEGQASDVRWHLLPRFHFNRPRQADTLFRHADRIRIVNFPKMSFRRHAMRKRQFRTRFKAGL